MAVGKRRRKYRMHTDPDTGKRSRIVRVYGVPGTGGWSTEECTGCTERGDYGALLAGPFGCSECGYTGRRRVYWWAPLPQFYALYDKRSHAAYLAEIAREKQEASAHA